MHSQFHDIQSQEAPTGGVLLKKVSSIRLSHIFEIPGISSEKPSNSIEKPSTSIETLDFDQKARYFKSKI